MAITITATASTSIPSAANSITPRIAYILSLNRVSDHQLRAPASRHTTLVPRHFFLLPRHGDADRILRRY